MRSSDRLRLSLLDLRFLALVGVELESLRDLLRNGSELIIALSRAIIYSTVVFAALQHAHLSSMAD